MFSPTSSAARPSFSLHTERPSSSCRRSTSVQASPARGSVSKATGGVPEIIDISRANAAGPVKFIRKGGKKHHAYDPKVAPYPLSYEPKIVDLDVLDHTFILQHLNNNITCIDFKDKPPKRSLDLGCGTGGKQLGFWKQQSSGRVAILYGSVGFDLVPIQPNLDLLKQPELSQRIQWVHGNFLTSKLPFEDDTFDHVHVYRIAWGVAEVQWDGLFEEVARILRPGGVIEVAEEDILFPTLPRSYTIKTKQPSPSAPYPRPSLTLSPPPSPLDDAHAPPHAHALLESLFFGVFESRMVNIRPTSIIPHHLNIHFRHVLSTPKVDFPLPPPPVSRQQLRHVPSDCTERPNRRQSDASLDSLSSSASSSSESLHQQQQQTPPTTNSSSSSLCPPEPGAKSKEPPPPPLPSKPVHTVFGSFTSTLAESTGVNLLPPVPVNMNDRSLAILLNATYQRILACKEAMWDELRRRLRLRRAGGPDLLHKFGWDDEDTHHGGDENDSGHGHGHNPAWAETREMEGARTRFEELTARFERDMRYRTALADALQLGLGWSKPAPAPMSKHERAREAELDKAIAAAARAESGEAQQGQYSRSVKGFIGFKAGKR